MAADGPISVVSRGRQGLDDGVTSEDIYPARGEPARATTPTMTVFLSFPRVAHHGERPVVTVERAVVHFDATGKAPGQRQRHLGGIAAT